MSVSLCTVLSYKLVANLQEILFHLINHFPTLNWNDDKFGQLVFNMKLDIVRNPQEEAQFGGTKNEAYELHVATQEAHSYPTPWLMLSLVYYLQSP
ncbi:hypothetical protein L0F63_002639 [Massospora cicadina]|nr:hypothetical protein L0F63_002639 [Massospora cicadina]